MPMTRDRVLNLYFMEARSKLIDLAAFLDRMTAHLVLGAPVLLSCVTVCVLSGCATAYKSNGFTGGFSATQVAPNIFRVYFRGNGYTSSERAEDFAMLRAAAICLEHNFTCFAILDEKSVSNTYNYVTPRQSYTAGTAYSSGNAATYSGITIYNRGVTYAFHKPRARLLIRGFQTKPDGIQTFDAAFLQKSVKEKYHIP